MCSEDDIRQTIIETLKPDFMHVLRSNLSWFEYKRSVENVAKHIPKNAKVVDVGCGVGYSTRYLSLLRPDLRFYGLDIRYHDSWKKLETRNCKFIKADAMKLPFNNGEFDVVISFGVMEHVDDDRLFLNEINRVLKKKGINVISHLPNKYAFNELLARLSGNKYHKKRYDCAKIRRLMLECGFKVEKIERDYILPLQYYKPVSYTHLTLPTN